MQLVNAENLECKYTEFLEGSTKIQDSFNWYLDLIIDDDSKTIKYKDAYNGQIRTTKVNTFSSNFLSFTISIPKPYNKDINIKIDKETGKMTVLTNQYFTNEIYKGTGTCE